MPSRTTRHATLGPDVLARRAAFRAEFLDFDRGIRVGHLQPEERITQLIKARLSARHGVKMLCDRWGRGVYWQWICWVPEPNKAAKPLSAAHNFASAKFFTAIDRETRILQSGMQIERAPITPPPDDWPIALAKDWDWHIFLTALRGPVLPRLLNRLLADGFRVRAGPFAALTEYGRRDRCVPRLRTALKRFAPGEWGGIQLYWPTPEAEVKSTPGPELIDAIMAVFEQVAPVMNLCMYRPCLAAGKPPTAT